MSTSRAVALIAPLILAGAGCREQEHLDEGLQAPPVALTTDARGDASQIQARAGAEGGIHEVIGRVERAGPTEIVIRVPGEPPRTLAVDRETRVTASGHETSAERLEPGAEVRTSFASERGERRAIAIQELPRGTARMEGGSEMRAGAFGGGAHGGQGSASGGEETHRPAKPAE